MLALVGGLVAVGQSRQSARTARAALVDQLVAQSVALRSTRRDLAALLAVQAYRLRPSAATRGALFGVFTASPGFLGSTPTGTTTADRVPLAGGAFLPDGHTLLAVGTDGIARELDPATGRITGRFPPPALTPINARMDLARDGHTLAVISWEGPEAGGGRATLAVYDTATRRRRLPDTRLPLDVGAVAVSPTGRYVAVSGYSDGRVLIFDTQGRARLPVLLNVYQNAPGVRRLGPFGAAPDTDAARTVRHTAALTFRPDGQLLAGSTTGVVRLVDPATGRETRRFTGAPALTSNTTFTSTPDGQVLLSTGTAGIVRWDPRTGRPLWSALIGQDRCGTATVVGDQVLCGGRFGRVESLDLRTGSPTAARYDMQHGPLSDLVVTPTGRTLVELADTQPVIARWRLNGTGPITRLLPPPAPPPATTPPAGSCSPQGRSKCPTAADTRIRSSGSSTPEPAPSSGATTTRRIRQPGPDDPASWPRGTGTTKVTWSTSGQARPASPLKADSAAPPEPGCPAEEFASSGGRPASAGGQHG